MPERFLTLMAELDGETQKRLSGWYGELREAGFSGAQTRGCPTTSAWRNSPWSGKGKRRHS